jgi:hypothetical protein
MCAPQLCSWSAALLFLIVERLEAESTDTGGGVAPARRLAHLLTRVEVATERLPELTGYTIEPDAVRPFRR